MAQGPPSQARGRDLKSRSNWTGLPRIWGLPDSIRESAALLPQMHQSGAYPRRLIESVVSAVIYATCRMQGIPRTLTKFRGCRALKEIGYTALSGASLTLMSPLDPGTMCEYGSAQIVGHVQERDFASEKAILKGLISGRGPTGVAAAAVLYSWQCIRKKDAEGSGGRRRRYQ